MKSKKNDYVSLPVMIERVKLYYPSFKLKEKKELYKLSIFTEFYGKRKWTVETRDELIAVLSGLIVGYEINVLEKI